MNGVSPESAPGVPCRSHDHVTLAARLTSAGIQGERTCFPRQATKTDYISPLLEEHNTPPRRHRPVGRARGGMTLIHVARELGSTWRQLGAGQPATDQERQSRTAKVEAGGQP